MAYENIIFEKDGDVAVIKFNRPKALNAINPAVLVEVDDALDQIEEDPDVRVLILTGEGEKAFVAGADIAHMVKLDPLEGRKFSRDGQELLLRTRGPSHPGHRLRQRFCPGRRNGNRHGVRLHLRL